MKKLAVLLLFSVCLYSPFAGAQVKRTNFDPATNGFNFVNDFSNSMQLPLGADVRTAGLCGGFVYAALDYFNAGPRQPVPRQNYRPADGTVLQQYLLARQITSTQSNAGKWAELIFNPGGSRDTQFFNWGLQGAPGGRIAELRSYIDRGIPVPLGLKSHSGGDHQVLAIGYDMGRYRGDLGAYESDFKIFVYDSNHPNRKMILIPDLANKVYKYPDGDNDGDKTTWRTYFVDTNYHYQVPPHVADAAYPNDGLVHELVLEFHTGSDDMRGGNDNLDLAINLLDGTQQHYPDINLRARWISNYVQFARIILTQPVPASRIKNLVFNDTFGGDNWDMAELDVHLGPNLGAIIRKVDFHRFTSSDRQLTVPINSAPLPAVNEATRLVLEIRTGGDDLRGGNDNLNIITTLADGRSQTDLNVNNSAKWDNNSTHIVTITLNKPVPVNQIRSVTLATTFSGGSGGDNWNMDSLKVTALVQRDHQVVATYGFNRFTGDKRQLTVAIH